MNVYTGKIFWSEQTLHIKKKNDLITWLSQFEEDSWFDIQVTPVGKANNGSQPKLYWKWCDIIHKEYGWDSSQEVHTYLKNIYNNGESTKGFDTKQWSEYMIKVQAFANENDITLPLGNSID